MIKYLKKRTANLRYIVICYCIKHFTPSLYERIETVITDRWGMVPRPSIIAMKKRFKKKELIGAEIGVRKGVNAESILKELNIKKLYLIDGWSNYKGIDGIWGNLDKAYELVLDKFKKDKRVQIIKDFSENAVKLIDDNSLDFVYIDGNHLEKYVYQDICLWSEKVKKGGIVAGHDIYSHVGVSKAVKKFWYENDVNIFVSIPDWYFIKENKTLLKGE